MRAGIRVLHVDDEPDLAELTAEFLVREDDEFTVVTERSVADALARLETETVDCIVSDYEMPGTDGIEFLETIRDSHPDLPFILYTGRGSEEVASDAISAGVTDYLQKESGTSQYEVLANRIRNAVEQARSRAQLAENERRLAMFFEESPLGTIEWTEDFHVARVNPAAEDILGYSEAELVGASWETLVPPDQHDAVDDVVDDVLADRGGYHFTNENVRKDGERITCEWHNRIILDDGEFVASFSKFHDITARTERERKLSELRDRVQDLMYTETAQETAAVATRAADDIIDAPLSGVHLLTDDGDVLESAAFTDTVPASFDLPLRYERDAQPGSRSAVIWDTFEQDDPLHIEDTSTYEPLDEPSPAGSVVLYPLGDHGLFVISAPEANAFDETDEALAAVLASFLTTALDRVEREQRLRERERRLEQLHDASRQIMTAETPTAIAEHAVQAAEDILDFRIALVREYDPELDALVPIAETAAVEALLPERTPYSSDSGSVNWDVYESGELGVFEDVQEIPGASDRGTVLRSLLILPLGEYGTLSVGETIPGAFDEADVFLVRILATATEAALDRTDRETDIRVQRDVLERREHALRTMHDVIADRDLPFDEQVEALLELGREELGVGYGTLSRIEDGDYHFEIVASDDDTVQAGDVAPLSATNCEIAAATEQTLVLGDVERDAPDETDRAGFTDWGIACYIGAPVYSDDAVYGTFCFYDTTPRDGQFSEWEVTLVDLMSRWVSTELHRQRTTDRLQREYERLDRFASMVSHDLRNPLNVLSGRLQLAEETGDPEEFERCRAAIARMESLIDDLLDLARGGSIVADREPVDLADLATECWATIATPEATLVVDTTRTLEADRPRLKQVIENLLTNAVVHGGDDVTVTIDDLDDGFSVADDGPGIPLDERATVFDYGYSTHPDGNGFGLSIVHEIATAHGWDVDVTADSNGGARFEFTGVSRTR